MHIFLIFELLQQMHNYFNCYLLHLLIAHAFAFHIFSNYNHSKVNHQAIISEPMLIIKKANQFHNNHRAILLENFHLRKYELRDTNYKIDEEEFTYKDQMLVYQMEPPAEIFSSESISIENYRLNQIRPFSVKFNNPSSKLTLCVTDIISDSEEIKSNNDRKLMPLCLLPSTSKLFNFTLYVTSPSTQFARFTMYFFVEIYDVKILVQEKTYARKIFATITPNLYKIENTIFKQCPKQQFIILKNYENVNVFLRLESHLRLRDYSGDIIQQDIELQPLKVLKLQVQGKPSQFIIHTSSQNNKKQYPTLLIKCTCEQKFIIDYQNIGIIVDERIVIEFPLTVSSKISQNITITQVQLISSSQVVLFQQKPQFNGVIPPFSKFYPIANIRVHSSQNPAKKSSILVKIKYKINNEVMFVDQKFIYAQIRNAITFSSRRFIDITKQNKEDINYQVDARFPIRNHLNIPIYLNRVFIDQSIFKLIWQTDRRKITYPNLSIQQFQLNYIGPLSLPLSPLKYIATLEFNGNILIPTQIYIYDKTLQCLYENVVYKCSEMTIIDFGYFRDRKIKSKQFVIRNWNPEPKKLHIRYNKKVVAQNNLNMTVKFYRPAIGIAQSQLRYFKEQHYDALLRPQQFILINIDIQPLQNATSTNIHIQVTTQSEKFTINLNIKIQNGTIALVPQIIRINNQFQKQIQYINLISTYAESYSIKNITINLTQISVHYNHDPMIVENQWIGMSVVYNPFQGFDFAHHLWSNRTKQIEYIIYRQTQSYKKIKYAKIILRTTNKLQVNSTIIIENNHSQIIVGSRQSTSLEGVYEIQQIVLKRKKRTNKKPIQQRYISQFKIKVKNVFKLSMRYQVYMLSQVKFHSLDQISKLLQMSTTDQYGFFCISDYQKLKWSLNAQSIKNIFRLTNFPQQFFLQSQTDQFNAIKNNKNNVTLFQNKTINYLKRSYLNQFRTCFYFPQKVYILNLILQDIINKLLIDQGLHILYQFLKHQFNHLQNWQLFQLPQYDSQMNLKEDILRICSEKSMIIYRFCHYLRIKHQKTINTLNQIIALPQTDKSYVLKPGESHLHTYQISNHINRDSMSFFIVISNNLTLFQTYKTVIHFEQPKLSIQGMYVQDHHLQKKEIQTLVSLLNPEQWKSTYRFKFNFPIIIGKSDYNQEKEMLYGSRTFQIMNKGDVELDISHIGIQNIQQTCTFNDIAVEGLTCNQNSVQQLWFHGRTNIYVQDSNKKKTKFKLQPKRKYNITIIFKFQLFFNERANKNTLRLFRDDYYLSLYLYDTKDHKFRIRTYFKIIEKDFKQQMIYYMQNKNERKPIVDYKYFNIVSIVLLVVLLVKLQQNYKIVQNFNNEEIHLHESDDPYIRILRKKKLSKIIRQSYYSDTNSSIGTKINRSTIIQKPIHIISDSLISSAKQCTNNTHRINLFLLQQEISQIGGYLGLNNLSFSNEISDEHFQNDNIQRKIANIDNDYLEEQKNIQQSLSQNNQQASNESHYSSSNLPQGQVVNQLQQIDENSQYDFVQTSNRNINKSNSNSSSDIKIMDNEHYNVFQASYHNPLKKQQQKYYTRIKYKDD